MSAEQALDRKLSPSQEKDEHTWNALSTLIDFAAKKQGKHMQWKVTKCVFALAMYFPIVHESTAFVKRLDKIYSDHQCSCQSFIS